MSRYQKTIAAIVGAILTSIDPLWDLSISKGEAILLITVWATALGVYTVPNNPPKGEPADPHISETGPVAPGPARDEHGRFTAPT